MTWALNRELGAISVAVQGALQHQHTTHLNPSLSIRRSSGMGVMKTWPRTWPKALTAHSRRSWSEAEGGAPPDTSLRQERGRGRMVEKWLCLSIQCARQKHFGGQQVRSQAHRAMASTSPKSWLNAVRPTQSSVSRCAWMATLVANGAGCEVNVSATRRELQGGWDKGHVNRRCGR